MVAKYAAIGPATIVRVKPKSLYMTDLTDNQLIFSGGGGGGGLGPAHLGTAGASSDFCVEAWLILSFSDMTCSAETLRRPVMVDQIGLMNTF